MYINLYGSEHINFLQYFNLVTKWSPVQSVSNCDSVIHMHHYVYVIVTSWSWNCDVIQKCLVDLL